MEKPRFERRKYKRVKADVKVTIQKYKNADDFFTSEEGVGKNISAGGLLVNCKTPADVPSYVIAMFQLPGSGNKLEVVARVVRVEELTDNTYDLGLMFMRTLFGEFEELEKYIQDKLEE